MLHTFLFMQVTEFRRSLNTVNSACEEVLCLCNYNHYAVCISLTLCIFYFWFKVRKSDKLKDIMKKILFLGNTLNQGTARGKSFSVVAISFLKEVVAISYHYSILDMVDVGLMVLALFLTLR